MFVWPGLTEIYLCHAACSCQEMLRVRPGRQAGVGRWYCGRPMPGTAQQALVAAYRSAKNVRAAQLEVALAEVGRPWPACLSVCLPVCRSTTTKPAVGWGGLTMPASSLLTKQTPRHWVSASVAALTPPPQRRLHPVCPRVWGGCSGG
jgi:hypothetical protein